MTNPIAGKAARAPLPWGLLGMLALVWAVESFVSRHHPDLAPSYSLEWRRTSRNVREHAPRSEILCFGDSLVKVGVAPRVLEQRLGKRVYNFALSAGPPVASYGLFRRALEAGARPAAVLLDSKWTVLADSSVNNRTILSDIFGPREFLDLAWTARDPCLFANLMVSRALPSFHVRFEIRADVLTALHGEAPPRRRNIDAWRRNWWLNHGAHHPPKELGYHGEIDLANTQLLPDAWQADPIVAAYLERFFALAQERNIAVFWLIPPTVPALQARHEQAGTDRAVTRFARQIQARFPHVVVIDGRYARYPHSVFIDPTHLDCQGAALYSDDLAPIIGRVLDGSEAAERWVALPPFRERSIGVDLEDVERSAQVVAAAQAAAGWWNELHSGRPLDDQHLERPGTMHSLDAAELDVGGGRRARDPGHRPSPGVGRVVQKGHGLGDEADDLVGTDYAEVIVGQERQHPPPLAGSAVEHDRPGLRDPQRRRGQDAVARLDLLIRQPGVGEHPHASHIGHPAFREVGRDDERANPARGKRGGDGGRHIAGRDGMDGRLVFGDAFDEQLDPLGRGCRIGLPVVAPDSHHLGLLTVRDVEQGCADATDDLGAGHVHVRDLHHSRNVWLATG